MKTGKLIVTSMLAGAGIAHAGPRASASYSGPTDTIDAGGARTTSANYTNDGSLGGIAGLSTVAVPAETAKSGYIGQLYEVVDLQLAATPATVNEGGTRQLTATQLLDDSSTLAVPAASVAWSVASGPLASVNVNGLATAGIVYQDTVATAQGSYAGLVRQLGVTVMNVSLDDYGSYAGDGLQDGWQNQYFSANPAGAGPLLDPDGDGQNNFFEWTAGLVPTDPLSRFLLEIAPVPGQPAQKNLVFSPRFNDRTYTVKSRTDLAPGSWSPTTVSAPSDNGTERTVTDTAATGAKKFYRVEISKP